jgi:hypothetical protein
MVDRQGGPARGDRRLATARPSLSRDRARPADAERPLAGPTLHMTMALERAVHRSTPP